MARLRRGLKLEQAKFRVRNSTHFKNKYQLDAKMVRDKGIRKIEDEITTLEVQLEVRTAVAEGYEAIRNAASREMFRRSSEQAPKD